jgi:Zn-dependent protease with chaperone function
VPGEWTAFVLCLLFAPFVIGLIGLLFHSVTVSDVVLLVVGGMVFVSISRGRLLGSSVRVEPRQLPELHAIVERTSALLGIEAPQIFVRDDPNVPIASVGIGQPYALIVSSQYFEHLREGELVFLVARELAHIAAGHTRFASLLSASGRENPVVALVFGAWLRRTEYTADRVGSLCAGSFSNALGAISITTFHAIGRRVDMHVLAEQRHELKAEPALRMGEWLGGMPYATNRISALVAFRAQPQTTFWQEALKLPRPVATALEPAGKRVARRDTAPLWRRLGALFIDLTVLTAILNTAISGDSDKVSGTVTKDSLSDVPSALQPLIEWAIHHHVTYSIAGAGVVFLMFSFFVYSAILVGVSGQTLGMMIMELRVVTTNFARPGLLRVLWRYSVALVASVTAIALIGFFVRVHPHDRLSGTRLVRGRKLRI